MKSNENTMCELVRELKKKYQLESEENFIRIQINNRNYRICFYRIYKDRDGKIKKEKDKIQFWVENEAAIDNYLTTYQGVNEEKMIANMYKEIFYYNPLNSEMDSVDLILKSFEKFIKESSETRLCNHHKYVKYLVKICKNIFQEEQLNEDLKEKINAVLSVRISDIETEYCGCKQTRELMEIIRAKMIDREFIVSNWPEKVNKINEDLREQKKSEKKKRAIYSKV